jgi:hypothetical protein
MTFRIVCVQPGRQDVISKICNHVRDLRRHRENPLGMSRADRGWQPPLADVCGCGGAAVSLGKGFRAPVTACFRPPVVLFHEHGVDETDDDVAARGRCRRRRFCRAARGSASLNRTAHRTPWSTPGTCTGAGSRANAMPPSCSVRSASWTAPPTSSLSSATRASSAMARLRPAARWH